MNKHSTHLCIFRYLSVLRNQIVSSRGTDNTKRVWKRLKFVFMGLLEINIRFEKAPFIDGIIKAVENHIKFPIENDVGIDRLFLEFQDYNFNKSEGIYFDIELFLHLKENSEESIFDRIKRTQNDGEKILQEMQNIFGSNQLHRKKKVGRQFDEILISTTTIPNYLFEVVVMILIDMGGHIESAYNLPNWVYLEWRGVDWWKNQQ